MIHGASFSRGWPATGVWELAGNRRIEAKSPLETAGDEVVLAAVANPPRICETRPIAALIPDVLARYGLNRSGGVEAGNSEEVGGVDLLA